MIKTGIYRSGKIYHSTTSSVKIYEVLNRLDMWPSGNQEVEFEIKGDKAIVKKLGKVYDPMEADKLINPLKVI